MGQNPPIEDVTNQTNSESFDRVAVADHHNISSQNFLSDF
jgi:hypothetical protein